MKQGRRQTVRPRRTQMRAPELKAVDVALNDAIDSAGSLTLLNGITPGVGFDERIGRQVRVRKIDARLIATVTPSTGIDQFHRFILVLDHQPNGAAPTITGVLASSGVSAMRNLSNQARFQILYDETRYLNASAEPGSGVSVSFSIAKPFVVQYNSGVAGTVADIATNSLYLIRIGSAPAGATAGNTTGTIRVRYTDE